MKPTTTSTPTPQPTSWQSHFGAKKLILLTDVRGPDAGCQRPDSVIHRLKVSEVPKLVRDGVIKGAA